MFADAERHCADAYKAMIDTGVCAEQARAILPQSLLTEWYWSGTLMAFSRVVKLRNAKDAQLETRAIAKDIDIHMRKLFPVSWSALCGS
jgi:thymidylate synthase (FAD)